jgi:hypothetical protein
LLGYLSGTWVGSFEEKGTVYDTVEHLEQTLSSLKIRGQARNTAGVSYAYWHSSSETILEREGRLNYTAGADSHGHTAAHTSASARSRAGSGASSTPAAPSAGVHVCFRRA